MLNNTKITDIHIFQTESGISRHIADSTHDISRIAFYVVELVTESGIRGQGYLLSFHYSPSAIQGALLDIKQFILEHEYHINETLRFQREYEAESEYFGIVGLQRWALAVMNVAMWDAWGNCLGQPVWKIFGGSPKKIPVYGSGGWISYTEEELLEEVNAYKKRGFTAVKIKVGHPDGIERDIERLTKCRETLGPVIKIMMDANQGMDVPSAVALIKAVEDMGIAWFEEPVKNDDFEGYATIHENSRISLAMGEREYSMTALRSLVRLRALDLWQPDIIRLGGVEAWRDSAAYANACHIPVLPHYYKDYDVPLLCTIAQPYGAESFDWIDDIIDNQMEIREGYAIPRMGSGWGFRFKPECLRQIKNIMS